MGGDIKRARDPELLDALDAYERTSFDGTIWRVVRDGRSPLEPSRIGGRWDLGGARDGYDVLYTAMDPDGAIAEVEYHLSQQPVFPSRSPRSLHTIHAHASTVIALKTIDELVALGVERARYRKPLYDRTEEIGDAVAFLGCDALIVPSARWSGLNVVLFLGALDPEALELIGKPVPIDWDSWRAEHVNETRRRLFTPGQDQNDA